MWHLDVHRGVPSNWWILVSCETKSLLLFSCTVPSPGLGKRLCCTEKCTDTEQEWLWPWVCSQSAEEQVALGEERGAGRRSWRWDLSMETREAAAGHNPLPCPQHLPVQGVPVLNLCALKCTFSVLVIGSRLLEELPGVVVNTFP